jgi:hypothetical protein
LLPQAIVPQFVHFYKVEMGQERLGQFHMQELSDRKSLGHNCTIITQVYLSTPCCDSRMLMEFNTTHTSERLTFFSGEHQFFGDREIAARDSATATKDKRGYVMK